MDESKILDGCRTILDSLDGLAGLYKECVSSDDGVYDQLKEAQKRAVSSVAMLGVVYANCMGQYASPEVIHEVGQMVRKRVLERSKNLSASEIESRILCSPPEASVRVIYSNN